MADGDGYGDGRWPLTLDHQPLTLDLRPSTHQRINQFYMQLCTPRLVAMAVRMVITTRSTVLQMLSFCSLLIIGLEKLKVILLFSSWWQEVKR